MVRVATLFSILNTFLAVSEFVYPQFGGWNGLAFNLCTLTGLGILSALNVFSKRTISLIYLYRSGNIVEVVFFDAFWVCIYYKYFQIPKKKSIYISEFSNMQASFLTFSRSELTTYGKVWINLEKNVQVSRPRSNPSQKRFFNSAQLLPQFFWKDFFSNGSENIFDRSRLEC